MDGVDGVVDEALLRRLVPEVLTVLVRRGAGFAEAEDAVQEGLLDAVRSWPQDPPRDPKAWLVTVSWRRLVDATRAEGARRRREERLEAEPTAGRCRPPTTRCACTSCAPTPPSPRRRPWP